jgi:hypothetical protein
MDVPESTPTILDLSSDEMLQLFQAEARRRVAEHLASGQAVYSSGTGPEADHLYMHTPDGCVVEYRVAPNGRRMLVADRAS